MLRVSKTEKSRFSVGHFMALFLPPARGQSEEVWRHVVTTAAILCVMALCSVRPASGHASESVEFEQFHLFNACQPMGLAVEGLNDDARDIRLTEERLRVAADSRLRAARLYTSDALRADYAYLYVNVNVSGPAFSIRLAYNKIARDMFGRTGWATTWTTGAAGTHGRDASYIVSVLSEHLDRFLAAYLRVNEEACG